MIMLALNKTHFLCVFNTQKIEKLKFLPHIFFCYITKWMFVSVYTLISCVF